LESGRTRLVQTALWDPVGLGGRLYWYSLWPLHQLIFRSTIRGIAKEAGCVKPG
ncbi:MAG: DUF2867 domain-containing protein, partial [Thermoleophilia bacterium]|nr:DUF2867 domain-containing protein [Thermoleophilia bacterium]